MIDRDLIKHRREFLRALNNHQYEQTDAGVYFTKQKALASGLYTHDVNGMDERQDGNIVVVEGLTHMLATEFADGTKVSTWYLGLFSGNVTPLSTWTAANWVANATEIVSGTEGYTESTRVAFNETAPSAANVNNSANKAAFTIATATLLNVWGVALASASAKGATTGTLASAAKFANLRQLQNNDVFNIGYSLTLTST